MVKIKDKPLLSSVFESCRIAALAGEKSSGKSNNLVALLLDFRSKNKDTPIFIYGFNPLVTAFLADKVGAIEISTLEHLVSKQNCLVVLDEAQKLKLNSPKQRDTLAKIVDFVYHNNIYLLISSPNIRTFNLVLGSIIEKWLLKTVHLHSCVNGSQLKDKIDKYLGSYKILNSVVMPKNKLLVLGAEHEVILNCKYIKEVDTKKNQIAIF